MQNLRRAIAQVATEEKHVELSDQQVEAQANQFTTQAQQALQLGHEDLARLALQRKEALAAQVTGYKNQIEQLQAQEAYLADVQSKVEGRLAAFRGRKETSLRQAVKMKTTGRERRVIDIDAIQV